MFQVWHMALTACLVCITTFQIQVSIVSFFFSTAKIYIVIVQFPSGHNNDNYTDN